MIIMDIEASGLSDESYPIEIAWKSVDGSLQDEFLIRPANDWTYWDGIAAELTHNLTIDDLKERGISVRTAAERLNDKLRNEMVMSDGINWDTFWITKLFSRAGFKQQFELLPLPSIETRNVYRKHRAMADVNDLIAIHRVVQ